MAIRKVIRGSEPRLVIDFYFKNKEGRLERYRRDAQVAILSAARAEERRLQTFVAEHGCLPEDVAKKNEAESAVSSATFDDAVEVFEKAVLPTKKPSTRAGYVELLKVVKPRFTGKLLREIGEGDAAELDADLAKNQTSASRRRNVQVVLRTILRAAVMGGLLPARPKLPPLPKVGRTVVEAVPVEALPKILAEASPQMQVAIALAAYAGLRAGEVRGLRWGDVDEKRNILIVRRAISHGIEAPPKSGHARVLPLAAPLSELLKIARRRKKGDGFVVLTAKGSPFGEFGLLQAFQRCCERAKLPRYRFHGLRHFFVTRLFSEGVAAPVVQLLAGHGSLGVTQRYSHTSAAQLADAIGRLE